MNDHQTTRHLELTMQPFTHFSKKNLQLHFEAEKLGQNLYNCGSAHAS